MARAWSIVASIAVLVALQSPAVQAAPTAKTRACGPAWSTVATVDVGGGDNQFLALGAMGPDDVWAGGVWNGDDYGPLLEHWNGSAWTASTAAGANGFITGIAAVGPNDVWAVGDSTVPMQHWDGVAWSPVAIPLPAGGRSAALSAISALSPADVWAVGRYVKGSTHTLIEHWNGSAWTRVPSPDDPSGGSTYLRAVAGRAPNDVWAVGYAFGPSGEQPIIEHWNGGAWSVVPSPAFPSGENDLFGVAAPAQDDAWAVGMIGPPGSWTGVIERWNGSTWSVWEKLAVAPSGLFGVHAVSPDDVWVVGHGSDRPLVVHWDGAAWNAAVTPQVQPGGQGLDAVDGLSNGDLWAVGDGSVNGTWRTLAERVCPVKVTGGGFAPRTAPVPLGLTGTWEIPSGEAGSHSISDAGAMKLFDSGTRPPGGSFAFDFTAAGTYRVVDASTGQHGAVEVAPSAPKRANAGEAFTVTWATAPARQGFVFDVQMKPPGSKQWTVWTKGTTDMSRAFQSADAGSYAFRARLRAAGIGANGYSPPAKVLVG